MNTKFDFEEGKRLCNAAVNFSDAMQDVLIEKLQQGYKGWDDPDVLSDSDLLAKFMKLIGESKDIASDAVDIANFAMFMWYRRK